MSMWDDSESSNEQSQLAALSDIADAEEEWEARGEPTSGAHWDAEVARIQYRHGV